MISILHLIWIVPLSIYFGIIFAAVMSANRTKEDE